MARNGFKIFDADTHVRPDADLLEPYMSASSRQRLAQYNSSKARNKDGAVTYLMGERSYKRRLGLAGEASAQNKDYMSGYKRHQMASPIRFASAIRRYLSRTWMSKASMSI